MGPTGAKGEPGQGVSAPGPPGVPGSQGEPGIPGFQGEQHHILGFLHTPLQKNKNIYKNCELNQNLKESDIS